MPPKSNVDPAERRRIKALKFYYANRWTLQAQHKTWREKTKFEQQWGKDTPTSVLRIEERLTSFSWD